MKTWYCLTSVFGGPLEHGPGAGSCDSGLLVMKRPFDDTEPAPQRILSFMMNRSIGRDVYTSIFLTSQESYCLLYDVVSRIISARDR